MLRERETERAERKTESISECAKSPEFCYTLLTLDMRMKNPLYLNSNHLSLILCALNATKLLCLFPILTM